MIVYASEQKDGLEEQIQATNTVAYESPIILDIVDKKAEKLMHFPSLAFANLKEIEGLYRMYSILVTSNWNKNDDVFGKEEVWAARHTPENKPFNLNHNARQIIGHITHCVAVDDAYELIPDNTTESSLPDKFHILTACVIYQHLRNKDRELTKEASELIESVAKGEWFVSMEAMFNDFDYAISKESVDGFRVLERDNTTAHLTKHLRVYGGAGEYEGYKVGRYLKNITFSGEGLVKRPGNPESYTFNDTSKFKGVFNSFASVVIDVLPKSENLVDNNKVGNKIIPPVSVFTDY